MNERLESKENNGRKEFDKKLNDIKYLREDSTYKLPSCLPVLQVIRLTWSCIRDRSLIPGAARREQRSGQTRFQVTGTIVFYVDKLSSTVRNELNRVQVLGIDSD
jgi:hypothetical protein